MAWLFGSSEEVTNNNEGTVNSVTVSNEVKINDDNLQLLMIILIGLNIVKIFISLWKAYNRAQKKKYVNQGINLANLDKV